MAQTAQGDAAGRAITFVSFVSPRVSEKERVPAGEDDAMGAHHRDATPVSPSVMNNCGRDCLLIVDLLPLSPLSKGSVS